MLRKDRVSTVHQNVADCDVDVNRKSLLLLQLDALIENLGSTGWNMLSSEISEFHGLQPDLISFGGRQQGRNIEVPQCPPQKWAIILGIRVLLKLIPLVLGHRVEDEGGQLMDILPLI